MKIKRELFRVIVQFPTVNDCYYGQMFGPGVLIFCDCILVYIGVRPKVLLQFLVISLIMYIFKDSSKLQNSIWSCFLVYLQSTPEVCHQRIKQRCRKEELGIPLEYLQEIHDRYEEWLIKKTKFSIPAPVIVSFSFISSKRRGGVA